MNAAAPSGPCTARCAGSRSAWPRELAQPGEAAPDWSDFEWQLARAVAAMHGVSPLLATQLKWQGPPRWQPFLALPAIARRNPAPPHRGAVEQLDARAREESGCSRRLERRPPCTAGPVSRRRPAHGRCRPAGPSDAGRAARLTGARVTGLQRCAGIGKLEAPGFSCPQDAVHAGTFGRARAELSQVRAA